MQRLTVVTLAMSLAAVAACQHSEQKQAEDAAKHATAKAVEQAAKATEAGAAQAAKGLEQMAKGLEGMAGGDVKMVEPVSFRDLQALFPDLDGWEKAKPTGERMTAPFPFSQAEVRYRKNDSRLEIKIVDSGFNQLLFTPYAMFMQAGYEKETSSGYEKSTSVGGQPGLEKWNTEGKDGEVNAFVGKRYILSVEGRNVDDIKVLHDVVAKIDVEKLAALK